MKKIISAIFLTALAICAVSCKHDKEPEPERFEGIYYEEGTSDRQYLETVGNTVIDFIKANDQRTAITALSVFARYCDEYTFPESFTTDASTASRELADAIEHYDYNGLSRAANNLAITLARYKGLWQAQPDDTEWRLLEKRDDVVFRFWINKSEYNLVINGQGTAWTETITVDDTSYTVEVPMVLDITLLAGTLSTPSGTNASSVFSAKTTVSGKSGDNIKMDSDIRLGNIELVSKITATNAQLTDNMMLYVHNTSTLYRTTLASSELKLTGSGLCTLSTWQRAADNGNPLASVVTSCSAVTMIYNSVQIKSTVNNTKTFFDNVARDWDSYDAPNAKSQAEEAARNLRQSCTAELRYCSDTNQKVRGTLGWEAYMSDEYLSSEVWGIRPTLTFTSDGATFDFESFFGEGRFLGLENKIKNLMNAYKSYWIK